MAAEGRGKGVQRVGVVRVGAPPRQSVLLETTADSDLQLVRRMRELLAGGEAATPGVEVRPMAGGAVHFNALMLCLMSARYRRVGGSCFQDLMQEVNELADGALEKMRDLVHLGTADFAGARKQFFQCFHLVELLEMEECREAFRSALFHEKDCVALEVVHDRALLARLKELYTSQPRDVLRGFFDAQFMLQDSSEPCLQAHRLVLVAASGYFRGLLQHCETGDAEQPWRLHLADVSEAVLRAAMDLLYLGKTAVPADHFRAFALQADGWQADMLSEACWAAMFRDKELAEVLLKEGTCLPENLTVAVAYSHPQVVASEDDVDRFLMVLMNPALATHLSMSFAQGNQDDWCGDWGWGPLQGVPPLLLQGAIKAPRFKGLYKRTKGLGKSEPVACDQQPLGAQLERFMEGPGLVSFLQHPGAAKLPPWSASMLLESWFLRLSDCNPQHPWNGLPNRVGKGAPDRKPCRWRPTDWDDVRQHVAAWLLAWAAQQAEATGESQVDCLLTARRAVWHRRGVSHGEGEFRAFWLAAFRQALRADPARAEQLLLASDAHFAGAAGLRGRPEEQRRWANRHACYEAVFYNAGEDLRWLPERELGWPLASVSAATLLRLLASEEAPTEDASVHAILIGWLQGGADRHLRAISLISAVAGIETLLEHPARSRSGPQLLRFVRPRARAELLASLVRLADAGRGTSQGPEAGQQAPPPEAGAGLGEALTRDVAGRPEAALV